MSTTSNPFERKRKFDVPTARSPLTEDTEDTVTEQELPKTEAPVVAEAELSDRPDNGDTTPLIDPADPTKRAYREKEVLPLLDGLLQHGYALHTFKMRNVEVMLRTRFTWEEQYIYQHLEASDIKTALNYQREYAFITLAASIVKFGDHLFEPINTGDDKLLVDSITKRYEFIRSLNSVVTDIIQIQLQEFDDKQRYIIANFDKLLKAF